MQNKILLSALCLIFFCACEKKQESKEITNNSNIDTIKTVSPPSTPSPAKLLIGKWKVDNIKMDKALLSVFTPDERYNVETGLVEARKRISTLTFEFFKDKDYKMYSYSSLEDYGKYSLRSDDKDLVFKSEKDKSSTRLEILKLNTNDFELEWVIPVDEQGHKIPFTMILIKDN